MASSEPRPAAAGRECYHCRQWIAEGQPHDCWTTTEGALTRDLSEDLREAWERIRESAADLGEQRIYASHNSIMFARKVCYAFVRPRRKYLELWIFLSRGLTAPQVTRVESSSSWKFCNLVRITHRDQVEAPITDWLEEAYYFVAAPRLPGSRVVTTRKTATTPKAVSKRKTATKRQMVTIPTTRASTTRKPARRVAAARRTTGVAATRAAKKR